MNRGLLIKTIREVWAITAPFAIAVFIVETLIAYVLPTFSEQFADSWMGIEIVRKMLSALLSVDIGDQFGPHVFIAIAWVHPIVLTIFGAHATIFATRFPVGEIDRATIDVLMGLPVSRWQIYRCELVVFIATGLVLLAMAIAGNRLGTSLVSADQPWPVSSISIVSINLLSLFLAVGGLAWLVSSLSNRRGKAIAVVFSLLLASFLLSFLAQFWEPAENIVFLSILNYYQPLIIIRDGDWPTLNIVALLIVATSLWIIGGVINARRDICTV
ncbi:MAG: ABC transporter permease subunit [Planctomycetes bacterium]|nr:ABC transporter permease subunit [Planctomycetota bacterium]